jgi:hypothetical protein
MSTKDLRIAVALGLVVVGLVFQIWLSNFLFLALCLFLAAVVYRGPTAPFRNRRARRERYLEYLRGDQRAARLDAKSKMGVMIGFGLLAAAVVWMYFGPKFFDETHWKVVFGIAAILGVPGILLIGYREIIVGLGEYNASKGNRRG